MWKFAAVSEGPWVIVIHSPYTGVIDAEEIKESLKTVGLNVGDQEVQQLLSK